MLSICSCASERKGIFHPDGAVKLSEIKDPEQLEYFKKVRSKINEEWIRTAKNKYVSLTKSEINLSKRTEPIEGAVFIVVDKTGTITSVRIKKTTENDKLDELLLDVFKKIGKFDPPLESLLVKDKLEFDWDFFFDPS